MSGDTVAVGVPGDDGTGASGSVRVFTGSGATWTPQGTLTSTASALGSSVALDGDTIIAGAPTSNVSGTLFAGKAVVFVRSNGVWAEQATLIGAASIGENFGTAVALDGDTAVVGAMGGNGQKGSARIFERSGTKWTPSSFLQASDLVLGDLFGFSVALSGDTALVGARSASTGAGAAYIFVRSGSTWTLQKKLTPSSSADGGFFGHAVALDGDTALVGAVLADKTGVINSGAAYVFVRSGTTWTQTMKLTATAATANSWFGSSVALRADVAVVGAQLDTSSGSVFIFQQLGTTWSEQPKLKASDGASTDEFGVSVGLGGDALVIGARYDANAGGTDAGSAYVFSLKVGQGGKCTVSSGCTSGFCADGVCCDTACGDSQPDCQACSVAAGANADGNLLRPRKHQRLPPGRERLRRGGDV